MWRYVAAGVAAVMLVVAGVLLMMGRGETSARVLPAVPAARSSDVAEAALPDTVPEATPRTREQKRFGRYDKDRDGTITREEYLVARRKAFAKLDANKDGRLAFEEWAGATLTRFAGADGDRSGGMNAAEFLTTAPKRSTRARPRCTCPPTNARAQAAREADASDD